MNNKLYTIVSASQGWTGLRRMNPDHGTVRTAKLFIPCLQWFNPPRIECFPIPRQEPSPNALDLYCCTLFVPPPVRPPLNITLTPNALDLFCRTLSVMHPQAPRLFPISTAFLSTPHFLDLNCCQPPPLSHLTTTRRPPHPWRTTTPHFLDLYHSIKL